MDVDSRSGCTCVGTGGVYMENSVPFAQFFCAPKTARKSLLQEKQVAGPWA